MSLDTEYREHIVYSCERVQNDADINKTAHGPGLNRSNIGLVKQSVEPLK